MGVSKTYLLSLIIILVFGSVKPSDLFSLADSVNQLESKLISANNSLSALLMDERYKKLKVELVDLSESLESKIESVNEALSKQKELKEKLLDSEKEEEKYFQTLKLQVEILFNTATKLLKAMSKANSNEKLISFAKTLKPEYLYPEYTTDNLNKYLEDLKTIEEEVKASLDAVSLVINKEISTEERLENRSKILKFMEEEVKNTVNNAINQDKNAELDNSSEIIREIKGFREHQRKELQAKIGESYSKLEALSNKISDIIDKEDDFFDSLSLVVIGEPYIDFVDSRDDFFEIQDSIQKIRNLVEERESALLGAERVFLFLREKMHDTEEPTEKLEKAVENAEQTVIKARKVLNFTKNTYESLVSSEKPKELRFEEKKEKLIEFANSLKTHFAQIEVLKGKEGSFEEIQLIFKEYFFLLSTYLSDRKDVSINESDLEQISTAQLELGLKWFKITESGKILASQAVSIMKEKSKKSEELSAFEAQERALEAEVSVLEAKLTKRRADLEEYKVNEMKRRNKLKKLAILGGISLLVSGGAITYYYFSNNTAGK